MHECHQIRFISVASHFVAVNRFCFLISVHIIDNMENVSGASNQFTHRRFHLHFRSRRAPTERLFNYIIFAIQRKLHRYALVSLHCKLRMHRKDKILKWKAQNVVKGTLILI